MDEGKQPPVEPSIVVGRDYLMRFLNHDSYLDVKRAVAVGEHEIRIEWVGALVKPTTIRVVASEVGSRV